MDCRIPRRQMDLSLANRGICNASQPTAQIELLAKAYKHFIAPDLMVQEASSAPNSLESAGRETPRQHHTHVRGMKRRPRKTKKSDREPRLP